ncbi:MAG TPA: LuxR C-terminal-related transcriptional regulator [Galbitalea sp.]
MADGIAVQSQWPMTGRDALIDQLTAVLRSDAVSAVLLTGASGIGKSRLAAEAAAILAADGWAVARVAASEILAKTPLGAIIPAIAPGRDALDSVVRDSLAIFDIARDAIARLADGRRVVLIVDDLTHLDPLSLTLVVQLVSARVVRLIATIPTGVALPDAFLSMWTDDSALRIEVAPLEVGACELLLGRVLGERIAHRSAVELHRLSGGNPLFLRELVIGAFNDGQLIEQHSVWQLIGKPLGTPALRDLIRARLAHLDQEQTSLVERLAVCQPLTYEDIPVDQRGGLVALDDAGLLLIESRRGRTYLSLSHPQYAEAVRASLSRLATVDLLVDEATRVASREMTPEDELRVSLWRLDAGVESDPGVLFRATHLATLAGDHARVERLAAAAIEAGAPAAEMLLLQGQSVWTLGRISDALAIFERAAIEDELHPTTLELTGLIASMRASTYAGERDGNSLGLAILDAAAERNPDLVPTLAFPRSVLLLNLEQSTLSLQALEPATPQPGASDEEHAVFEFARALPLSSLDQGDEALAAGRAGAYHSIATTAPAFPLRRAQMVLETVLLHLGLVQEAHDMSTQSLRSCIEANDELGTRYNELVLGQCFLAMGQLDTAGRWFSDVISGSQARESVFYLDPARSYLALSLLWRGRPGEAAVVLADLDSKIIASHSTAALATLWLDAVRGGKDRATTTMIRRAREAAARGNVVLAAVLLHAASRLGAAQQAAPLLGAMAAGTTSQLLLAQAGHAHAEASGNVEKLTAAAEAWEAMGYYLFAGEAWVSASGAARKAHSERQAVALQNRAEAVLAKCQDAATPLLQFAERGERLTQREREIAGLAAQGLSSLDIAARLHLSARTVNNHLHAAYSKLGVRGRSELTDV